MSVSIPLRMTALSPISHLSDERAGNSTFFRTQTVLLPSGEQPAVPVVSGNSLRGQLRRFAVRRMLADLGVEKAALPPVLYHFFFSGGSLGKSETKTALPIESINALRAELPIIGLWGGTWAGTILPGALRFRWIYPVCAETAHLTSQPSEVAAATLLTSQFFTRRDDGEASLEAGEEGDAQQMIFECEVLLAGTQLSGGIDIDRGTEIETGFFSAVLGDWLASPTLGGQMGKGMGFVGVEPVELPDGAPYAQHLEAHREEMRNALRGMGALIP